MVFSCGLLFGLNMLELELFLTTQTLSIPVAFLAGVISFFAPCVVPLLPAYLSYVAGVSIKELKEKGYKPFRKKLILSSLIYVLGFSLVFMLLGGIAGNLGLALRLHSRKIGIAGGLLMVFFGLELLGLIKSPFIAKERKAKLPQWAQDLGYFKPFLLGIIFAAAWTPCIGPILGAILVLATTGGSPLTGALLLFVYSLGISLPFS